VRNFDVLGDGTVWHGTSPGYSTTSAGQFKLNDEVMFNVVSPLLFSNGSNWDVVADEDVYLRQFWPVFPQLNTVITASSGNQPGFLIGAIGNQGTLHQHHTFELATFSGAAPSDGIYAIQQVITADGYSSSEPFWIVLNNGAPLSGVAMALRSLPQMGVVGDFDRNGVLDIRDVHRLQDQISSSAEPSELTNEFDVSGDGRIDQVDLDAWVREVRQTWIGDANLDGEFNSSDMVQVFGFGHYEDSVAANSRWKHGDWNTDGEFDSGDLIAAFQDGGYELGARPLPVPEPNHLRMVLMPWLFIAAFYRWRK
ncbi:MAG: EF-hand domain-containing protein, partial [Planctomycetales bacterium]|nr:EF-hand domain-containing protein [Planctomycetales bacterium]